ncbi:MAG: VaFE repeat-containing surface-anchored protein [Clostridiales bacterium]|nr:VaFE repeat-containing surface-anchored protein [Clostridiales bacterium]
MKHKTINLRARIISAFTAATIAICTLPFLIQPQNVKAAVISSNALVSASNTKAAGYSSAKSFRDAILSACKRLDGVKYEWGGGGWNGIDCAGSVSLAYSVALGTATINSTPGSYGYKTLSYSGGGNPDKYGFYRPGFAGIKTSFTNGIFRSRGISASENHFSSFDTNGTKGIQSEEWITIINTYGIKPGDMIMWWNDDRDSTNAQHITIYAGIENGVPMQWTGSSSMGYFCKKPLADSSAEAGKGSFTGFMVLRATDLTDNAYAGFCIEKKDPSGIAYTGAVFSFYSDSELADKVGELRDDDSDGVYTDYYALISGSYSKQRYRMTKTDDSATAYEDKLYVKETTAPAGVILPEGAKISLTANGSLPDIYRFSDENIYCISFGLTSCDGSYGRLAYSVQRNGAGQICSGTIEDYSYTSGSDSIVIANTGSGSNEGLFTEASSIALEKTTSTELDITTTVFTVKEGSDLVATYKYKDGSWNWYDASDNKWEGTDSFPLKYGTDYVVTEKFSKPAPFKCADGTVIAYSVTNDTSGWTKVNETTYTYSFTTGDISSEAMYGFTVENNMSSGEIKVIKGVTDNDDSTEGFVFELWNEDKTKMLASGLSETDGIVYWKTGSGDHIETLKVPSGNYVLAEVKPDKCYSGSSAEYTYKVPEGFTDGNDGKWYKNITVGSETVTESVTNDRNEVTIKVAKSSDDLVIKGVKFELYYGGNLAEPSWQTKSLAKGSTNKNGVLEFKNLPVGWYRIDEIAEPVYRVVWDDATDGISRIIYLSENDDNKTLEVKAYNKLDIEPEIRTEFTNTELSHDVWCGTTVELVDKVCFDNLISGYEYVLTGSLYDKSTGDYLTDKDGNMYLSVVTFTADSSVGEETTDGKGRKVVSGYVDVPFTVDTAMLYEMTLAQGMESLDIVCFEGLTFRGISIAQHRDLEDADQTVRVAPSVKTTAYDSGTNSGVLTLSEVVTINDKVSFEGLAPGEKYVVTGTLIDKATGQPYTDPDGKTYTQELTFVPSEPSGFVVVSFEDVKVTLEPVELVVFESLAVEGSVKPIARHEDIDDEDQTVKRPACSTFATTVKGDKSFLEDSVVTVVDHIYFENLEVGKAYYAKAELCLSNGTHVISRGVEVVSIQEFEPSEATGTVDVTIKFDSSNLQSGDRVVVLETIYDKSTDEEIAQGIQAEDIKVLSHDDLDNMDQSLNVTDIPISGELTRTETVVGFTVAGITTAAAVIAIAVEIKRKKLKRNMKL